MTRPNALLVLQALLCITTPIVLARRLTIGDFASVNQVLAQTQVALPPTSQTQDSTTLRLTNIVCRNVQIGDLQVDWDVSAAQKLPLQITIQAMDLDLSCQANYNYDGFLLSGSGTVQVTSRDNYVTVQGALEGTSQPTQISLTSCNPTVNIQNIDFDNGGFLAWVLNLVEGLARNLMEGLVEDMLCLQLQESLQENAQQVLQHWNDVLQEYPVDYAVDPLQAEQDLPASSSQQLLDFSSPQTDFGQWTHAMIQQGMAFLQDQVPLPNNQTDMRANVWIRQYGLDEDRSLVVLDDGQEPVLLFYNHDVLLETRVELHRLAILGLDTLTQLEALDWIGQYTAQSQVAWETLALSMQATIDIRPSSLDNAVVSSTTQETSLTETVSIVWGLGQVQASLALLAAIHQELLESLQLGSFLSKANIVPCLVSTIVQLDLTSFSVQAGDIFSPYITGMDSVGLNRLLGTLLDISFYLYEDVILERSPAMFQQDVRELLNERFLQDYLQTASTSNCPVPNGVASSVTTNAPLGFVDFRDLLLNPVDSWALGGTGLEPYGDLFSSVVRPNLQAQIHPVNKFNEGVIRGLTGTQSGIPGALAWPEWGVSWEYDTHTESEPEKSNERSILSSLLDAAVVHVSNLRIFNLDTVANPLEILEVKGWNALAQSITLQDATRPLNVTASILLAIGGKDSPLAMTNQLDLTLTLPSTTLSVEILAQMKERDLLEFPLPQLTNPYCWLAALSPYVEEIGNNGETTTLVPLMLETVGVALETFQFHSKCISCTSPGAYTLSGILQDDLPKFGFQEVFTGRMVALMEDVAWNLWNEFDLMGLLADAPSRCPYRSNPQDTTLGFELFAEESTLDPWSFGQGQDDAMIEMHALSTESVETVLGLGIVAFQAGMVVAAQNHLLLVKDGTLETPDLSSIKPQLYAFSAPIAGKNIVDWTNLAADMGTWANFAFDELREYILAPVADKSAMAQNVTVPRFKSLMGEYILDEQGVYVMDLATKGATIKMLGIELLASQIRILGLESLSMSEVLIPIQPQVLRSNFYLDELAFVLDATLKVGNKTEAIEIKYSAKNVSAQLDLLVAVDLDAINEIQIGSVFDTKFILPCLASGIYEVGIHQLSTSVGVVEGPKLSGFLVPNFQDSVDSILTAMSDSYSRDLLTAMPIFLDSTFKDVVNSILPNIVDSFKSECPPSPSYPGGGLVDFRDLLLLANESLPLGGSGDAPYGDLFQVVYSLLEEHVLRTGASNRPVINDIFRHITMAQSNTSGTLTMEENAFDSQTKIKIAGLEASVGFQVSKVRLENMDSVGDPLTLFQPMQGQAHMIDNIVSFGVDSRPLSFAANVILSLSDGVEMNIRNEMRVALSLENVVIVAELLLKISENDFAAFPIGDLNDIDCWLATVLSRPSTEGLAFRGIGLEEHSFSIGNFSFGVSCIDCTSPDFDKLIMSLYNIENTTDLEKIISKQTGVLFDNDFFPVLLDRVVIDSARRCPHHPNYDPEAKPLSFLSSPSDSLGFIDIASSGMEPAYFNLVNGIIALLLFLFGAIAHYVVNRRNRNWKNSLSREGAILLQRQEEKDRRMQATLDKSTTSLFASPSIPRRVRYGVPVALLLNIGLFLGGHFGTLSVVNVNVSMAGEEFTVYEFLEFRFIESTRNTYNNGGAELAILLWVFTGIWPYIKLGTSLLLWILPPSRISVFRRGQALLWIDALAKLSVIDIFTMLLGFAVLLVFIGGPDKSLSASEAVLYSFKTIIIPRAGCYCLLVAQRMARVSSKFLLEYHDQVIDTALTAHEEYATKAVDRRSLASRSSSFSDPADYSDDNRWKGGEDEGSLIHRIDDVAAFVEAGEGRTSVPDLSSDGDVCPADRFDAEDSDLEVESKSEFRVGTLGVVFGAVTIVIIFIIGCIFAPAISLDTSSIASLAAESGMTYADVVEEYGVFLVISSVLVKASFVLDTNADYVGLGFFLFGALVSMAGVFFIQAYQFIRRKIKERRLGKPVPSYGHSGCGFPLYFRLHKWKHMEIYLISVAIGVWQLGSACSYAIHLYCEILWQIYAVMSYIGLVEKSTAQCSRIQASLPGNLTIIIGSFLMLLLAFFFQAAAQYKKNIAESLRFVDDDDVPRLSLAWSGDKSKNSRYSHLTASMSLDQLSSDELRTPPATPVTTASTPPGTPGKEETGSFRSQSTIPPVSQPCLTPPRSGSVSKRRNSSVRFEYFDEECHQPCPPRRDSQEMPSIAGTDLGVRLSFRPNQANHDLL